MSIQPKGKNSPYYKRVKVKCAFCGEILLKIPAHDKRAKHLFCNVECKSKWQRGMFGEDNPRWKGGRASDGKGYMMVMARDHPYANNRGYVFEHRLVVEKELKRYLLPSEIVHHLNGIKTDNRIENLMAMNRNNHDVFSVRHALENRIQELEKTIEKLQVAS